MLHIISALPSSEAFKNCLKVLRPGSSLVLIEDAVAAIGNAELNDYDVYVLKKHLRSGDVISNVKLISHEQFVELTAQHTPIHSWSE